MTKVALAQETKISVRSLKAYEAGTQTPNAMSLARLADVLDFPVEFFSREHVDSLPTEVSSFRALSRMTATKRDQALAAGELALDLSGWIDERFDLPPVDIPNYVGVDPELAADAVREEWGLGHKPIRNMIHLLEARGVRVFSLAEETRDVDAFSFWLNGIPYVFLNTIKSGEHSRMDAAHELGHLVMHQRNETPTGRTEEHEANLFGSAFLMPSASVEAQAPRGGRIPRLIKAKRHWNVSLAALVYRMNQLDLLTEWQYRSLFAELGAKGYRTDEPNPMTPETSQILSKVFKSLRAEGVTSAHVARELSWPTTEVTRLIFGLAPIVMAGGNGGDADSPPGRAKLRSV